MLTHFFRLGTNGVEHSQIVALEKAALNHVHAAGWRVVIKPCVDQQSSCSDTFCFQQKSKREAARRIGRPAGNLGDDQLHALAERGGLLGIMLHPLAIGHEQRTIGRVIDHFEHAAAVMGIEHVCLGGDFVQRLSRVLPPFSPLPDGLMPVGLEEGSAIEGLAGPEDYPALGAALAERGWPTRDIDAVTSANLLRFLRRALPA